LGSLLSIIYINDLPYGINADAKPVIYADDTRVLITANNLNSKLNYTSACFSFDRFSLNIAKTIYLNLAQTISKMIHSKLLIKLNYYRG